MATIPAVKASTQKKVKDVEEPKGNQLMRAIAETIAASGEGRGALARLRTQLSAREKHKPDNIRNKKR